jgi:hypothetical protein
VSGFLLRSIRGTSASNLQSRRHAVRPAKRLQALIVDKAGLHRRGLHQMRHTHKLRAVGPLTEATTLPPRNVNTTTQWIYGCIIYSDVVRGDDQVTGFAGVDQQRGAFSGKAAISAA